MPDSAAVATDGTDRSKAPGRHTLKVLLVPIVALVVLNTVGDMIQPTLVDTHPLLLVAMNARNRNLILVTNQLDAWSYYTVATARLLLSDPLFFLIGYWYGDKALTWIEERTNTYGQLLRQAEGWFGRAAYPLVFIAPNNIICLFAGAAGMSVTGFFVVNIAGTVARLFLIRRLGETFEQPIDTVLDFIAEYRLYLLAVTIPLFAYVMVKELRRSTQDIDALADAIDDDDEAPDDSSVS
jgi:membrane protein DedA with SNARE-associated domain